MCVCMHVCLFEHMPTCTWCMCVCEYIYHNAHVRNQRTTLLSQFSHSITSVDSKYQAYVTEFICQVPLPTETSWWCPRDKERNFFSKQFFFMVLKIRPNTLCMLCKLSGYIPGFIYMVWLTKYVGSILTFQTCYLTKQQRNKILTECASPWLALWVLLSSRWLWSIILSFSPLLLLRQQLVTC